MSISAIVQGQGFGGIGGEMVWYATAAGTGYAIGDVLKQVLAQSGSNVIVAWLNLTQQTVLATTPTAAVIASTMSLGDAPAVYVTGATTLSAGFNILNTVASGAPVNVSAIGLGQRCRSMTVQITGNPVSGALVFQGSNDNVNWTAIHAVEQAYEWTNILYSGANWPFAGTGAANRTFNMPIRYQYVRARITTVLGSAVQAFVTYSRSEWQRPNVGSFPSANNILNTTITSAGSGAILAPAPAAGLRNYFCGSILNDGASGGATGDAWIIDGSGTSSGPYLGNFSRSSTTEEGGNVFPPCPIPCTVGNAIQLYINGGFGNQWIGTKYFVAP